MRRHAAPGGERSWRGLSVNRIAGGGGDIAENPAELQRRLGKRSSKAMRTASATTAKTLQAPAQQQQQQHQWRIGGRG